MPTFRLDLAAPDTDIPFRQHRRFRQDHAIPTPEFQVIVSIRAADGVAGVDFGSHDGGGVIGVDEGDGRVDVGAGVLRFECEFAAEFEDLGEGAVEIGKGKVVWDRDGGDLGG